jgi:formyltetrahydrofolate-dependent phosphoribosylglycinamide formyltransferase
LSKPLDRPIRLAVLISGGGTTLVNLAAKIREGQLMAEVRTVVASRADCSGIQRARDLGLPCEIITRKSFSSIEDFSSAIFQQCRQAQVDLVVCGGFLALIRVPPDFSGRVINIHPALIPSFCGKGFHGHHVHEAVINRGVKFSGCTVHFVDDEYDHGPIILQRVVPVLDDDTPDELAARVFAAECEALPEAIRLFSSGNLEIYGSRVVTHSAG